MESVASGPQTAARVRPCLVTPSLGLGAQLHLGRFPILAGQSDFVVGLAGQIREHVRIGCLGPNQAKAYSRAGMGPCQGRLCGLTVSEIIAGARGVSPGEVGYYRIRPPIKPVTIGELAAMADEDGTED